MVYSKSENMSSAKRITLTPKEKLPVETTNTNGEAKIRKTQNVLSNHVRSASNGHVVHGESSFLGRFFNRTLVPLWLMAFSPNLIIVLWYTAAHCDGSFLELFSRLSEKGLIQGVSNIWSDIHIGSSLAAFTLLGYIVWALILMIVLPGPIVNGPITPKGNVPVYKDNGFYCFLVTIVGFCVLTAVLKSWGMSPTIVYDHFDEFLGTLTVFSHVLCITLHAKGLIMPSTTDCGTSGNLIFDYYWGTELYPRIFGIDVKVFTNCRFGMTVWPLLVLIFALKSYELHGFVDSMWVSAALQMIYFTKFFWWESGYMCTIDIMLDRAGFYICWGCLAFIPGLYASVSMYLVNHPVYLGPTLSVVIFVCGTASIIVNYLADKQKQDVRRSDGKCLIWGRKPQVLRVKYHLENGDERESLLLASGWWAVARHFHYIPELLLSLFWSLPALFHHFMPYCYFFYLCILLTHRAVRDENKCRTKYGHYWQSYCNLVPYRMVPGLF